MSWYAAHIVVSIRPIKPRKGEILVWENVVLIEARSNDDAEDKARKYGKASIVEDKTRKIDGEPAETSFLGVRKIISVSNPWPLTQKGDRPVDGTEITYSRFTVKDKRALAKLVNGDGTVVRYIE
jgi:hypothetical protein